VSGTGTTGATVRRATLADVDQLVDLRVAFVRELAHVDEEHALRDMVDRYLQRAIPCGDYLAWVVEDAGAIVATGGMVVYERMMGRGGVGLEGYVLSVFTVPVARRKGHGAKVMTALQDHARANDIRLTLIATDDGRPLYEGLGWNHEDRTYRWLP
jgi:GNAT superfamily N-acetyltransferase